MELEIICDDESFQIDEYPIEIEPKDELVAFGVKDETDLTFLIKGLVNKVTGCLITGVELYDGNNQFAQKIPDIQSMGQVSPGVF